MRSTLKILGATLLFTVGIIKLINAKLEKDLSENFESNSINKNGNVISDKPVTYNKENLDFYSNEYVSFYYPKNWTLSQNRLPGVYSISLKTNDNCEFIGSLGLVIQDNPISAEEALKSVLKGFLKNFDNYEVHNSTKTLFKDNVSVYKKVDIKNASGEFFSEAFAFRNKSRVFTIIKLCDSESGLNQYFDEIEKSFEILLYKKEENKTIVEETEQREKLAREGDKASQAFLGYAFLTGSGAPVNYEKAFYWNKKLAEDGYSGSMYLLGYQYNEGLGTKKDITKGNFWMDEARKNGFKP